MKVQAYSVLSHEALIDSAWEMSIRPLLVKRFPNATNDELRQAHGFAYGGSIIQDIGYYPHGSHFFSDLLHYVGGGNFIIAMIRFWDLNDTHKTRLASHYAADNNGHRIAVILRCRCLPRNWKSTRTSSPGDDQRARGGAWFDVLEVASARFGCLSPSSLRRLKDLLERAFQTNIRCRYVPSSPISTTPLILPLQHSHAHTRGHQIAWQIKKTKSARSLERRCGNFNTTSPTRFEKEWGKNYDKPSTREKFLAFVIRVTPKIGPLKVLAFQTPTPQMEKMFMDSFNVALAEYRRLLAEVKEDSLNLPNRNFDTGTPVQPGTYFMQDDAYGRLLHLLAKDQFRQVSDALRSHILSYFAALNFPANIKRDRNEKTRVDWKKVPAEIRQLQVTQPESNRAQTCDPPAVK
jgi:hypothetical protein